MPDNSILLQQVFDAASTGLIHIDRDYRITRANAAYERVTGRPIHRIVGAHLSEIMGRAAFERIQPLLQQTLNGERVEYEHAVQYPEGGLRWVHVVWVPNTGAQGEIRGGVGCITDVTHLRTAEEQLRESEQRYRAVFNSAPIGIAQVNSSGGWMEFNDALCSITEYRRDELARLTFADITHPDDLSRERELFRQALHGEREDYSIEKRYIRKSGMPVWVSLSVSVVRGDAGAPPWLIFIIENIDERRRALTALSEQETQLRFITNHVPLLIVHCDASERYLFVNAAYAQRFGTDPGNIVGRRMSELLLPDAYQKLRPHIEAVLRGETVEFEEELPYSWGSRWMHCNYVPEFDNHGDVVSFVAVIQDVTARRVAEDAVREADRRKDEFLALLAHELRNPLAPLRTGLAILERDSPDLRIKGELGAIMKRQLGHLVRLVDDLLDVSRLSHGKLTLRHEVLSLSDVLTRAIEISRPLIEAHAHQLTIELPGSPVFVFGDQVRLTQVVSNLLNNAAKFTPAGGTIVARAWHQDGSAFIAIEDSGAGLAEDELPRVFDRLFQKKHGAGVSNDGLGLGLYVAKQLVELHHGSIQAFSRGRGKGAEFVVSMPLHGPVAVSEPSMPAEASRAQSILLVEDNADIAASFGQLLRLYGNDVRVACDGAQAQAAFEAVRPSLVLVDIGLPDISGHELCERLRGMQHGRDPIIIALTGWGDATHRARGIQAGFDAHLVKPVDVEDLFATVATISERRGMTGGPAVVSQIENSGAR